MKRQDAISRAVGLGSDPAGLVLPAIALIGETVADPAQMRIALARQMLALEAAQLGSFDIRPQEGLFCWDRRCAELFGYHGETTETPAAYVGAFLGAVHPGDRDRLDAAIQSAMFATGPGRFECDFRVLGSDGFTVIQILAQGMTLFQNDRPWRLIGTVQDVTAEHSLRRKLAEAQARVAEAKALRQDLINGQKHGLRNLYTTILGLERRADVLDDPRAGFRLLRGWLGAMALVSDLLAAAPARGQDEDSLDPVEVAQRVLGPHGDRISFAGKAGRMDRQLLHPLVLLLHGLAAQSLDRGALARADGRIELFWRDRDGEIEMSWRESPKAGAQVAEPIGSALIDELIALLSGRVRALDPAEGCGLAVIFPRQ